MPILDLNSWRDGVEAKNIFDRPHIRICGKCLVGTGRFELPTPRTPSECSTRLSHVPTARNRSLIERLGLSLKFYTSLRCRVAEQEASISVSALLRAGLVLRQSQIEFSFLQDLCDQPKPECAAPGDRFFGCAGR